jgi:hypothetical protein
MDAVANSAVAMDAVAASTSAMDAVIASTSAMDAVFSDTTAKGIFKGSTALAAASIPEMTSANAPSGSVSASSFATSSYEPYKAFDGSNSNEWLSANGSNSNQWIRYDFTAPVYIHSLLVDNRSAAGGVDSQISSYRLECSVDGSTWLNANGGSFFSKNSYNNVDVVMSGKYRHWRLYMISNHGGTSYLGLKNMQLTGFV